MRRQSALAYAFIIFVNVAWGLSFIASKQALGGGFQPFTLALVRFAISSLLLLPVTLVREGRPRFTRHEWMRLLFSALSGITLYFLFEYMGLQYTTASNASLVLSIIPVLTMALGAVRHRQRYPVGCWIGALLSLTGVFLVVRYGGSESAQNPLLGNTLLLGACLCWVLYIELTSSLLISHSSLSVTCYQGAIGMLTLIPCALTELPKLQHLPPSAWLAALFLGIVCSALCYILYTHAMRYLKPLRTALFININPLSACLGGVLLLGETLNWQQLLGGAIILTSIFFTNALAAKMGRS